MRKKLFTILLGSMTCTSIFAQENDSLSLEQLSALRVQDSLIKSFHYLTGTVTIGKNLATVKVPEGNFFLEPLEARVLLENIYGNMPDPDCLGVLLSDTPDVFLGCTWIVNYNYNGEGHVDDDDASDINYDDLLKQMKEDLATENAERVKMGYESVEMFGWAKKPYYDPLNKKLHWAKDLSFGGSEMHTLNYNIRVLGREGFLEMNIISGMNELTLVEKDIDKILKSTDFINGSRYADYNSGTDKLAEYGIGGLIVGGILAKTGFFANIGIFLLKFIKPIIVGIIALGSFIAKRIFGRKNKEEEIKSDPTA